MDLGPFESGLISSPLIRTVGQMREWHENTPISQTQFKRHLRDIAINQLSDRISAHNDGTGPKHSGTNCAECASIKKTHDTINRMYPLNELYP